MEVKLTDSQREDLKKEIKFISSTHIGKLYLDAKFSGIPCAEEYLIGKSGIYGFLVWLYGAQGKDGDLALRKKINKLSSSSKTGIIRIMEEISIFRGFYQAEVFRRNLIKDLREKQQDKHDKKKSRELKKKIKIAREAAKFSKSINLEEAICSAKKKIEAIPPPSELIELRRIQKNGRMWMEKNTLNSSKREQVISRLICIIYEIAEEQSRLPDSQIKATIAEILNMLQLEGKKFTTQNIRNYIDRHSTN